MARPPPDGSTISCVYSRIFCQPHLLQCPSGIVSWATYRSFVFSSLTGCSEGGCSSLASRINGISWTTSKGLPVPSLSRVFFSGGLEWPSCVKEYPSLLQSRKSASYQTLRMWVAGPHRRTPHLGPFVSSSEDSLHQHERASSSSVRPEGLRTPVGRPVGHSVLRQHHHSSVCLSPAAIHHGLVQCHSGRSQSPHMVIEPEWTLHQDIVDQLVHKWPAVIRLFRPP